jgi:hypothetical protein
MTRRSAVEDPAAGATRSYPPLKSRIHSTQVLEKVPGRIVPADEAAEAIPVTLQRFMGVLVHPVPRIEFLEKCGEFVDGGKVYLEWSRDLPAWFRVEVGDRLEVEDRAFTIAALDEVPIVYTALYVREA